MSSKRTICTVCDYVYEEVSNEAVQKHKLPSARFKALPSTWRCPGCCSGKQKFQVCSCDHLPAYEHTCRVHGDELKALTNLIITTV